jgi:hypothetical protein
MTYDKQPEYLRTEDALSEDRGTATEAAASSVSIDAESKSK